MGTDNAAQHYYNNHYIKMLDRVILSLSNLEAPLLMSLPQLFSMNFTINSASMRDSSRLILSQNRVGLIWMAIFALFSLNTSVLRAYPSQPLNFAETAAQSSLSPTANRDLDEKREMSVSRQSAPEADISAQEWDELDGDFAVPGLTNSPVNLGQSPSARAAGRATSGSIDPADEQDADENLDAWGSESEELDGNTSDNDLLYSRFPTKKFRADLADLTSVYHEDDVSDLRTTLYIPLNDLNVRTIETLGLSPENLIKIRLEFNQGYSEHTPPAIFISQAGALQGLLQRLGLRFIREYYRDGSTRAPNFLSAFCAHISAKIRRCTQSCPICEEAHPIPTVKLLSCLKPECQWKLIELGVGCDSLYELLCAPMTTDLLLTMTYVAANSPRRLDVLKPIPPTSVLPESTIAAIPVAGAEVTAMDHRHNMVSAILQGFPALSTLCQCTSAQRLKETLNSVHPFAYGLFRWIVHTNRTYFKPIDLSELTGRHPYLNVTNAKFAFEFLSNPPEKEALFAQLKERCGSRYLFHGSPVENWHSIIRNRIVVMSGTAGQINGAAYGAGIYLAAELSTSAGYSRGRFERPNQNDALRGSAVLIVEVAQTPAFKPAGPYFTTTDPDGLMFRYLLIV